jgi:hypothetical protein
MRVGLLSRHRHTVDEHSRVHAIEEVGKLFGCPMLERVSIKSKCTSATFGAE